jgi:hypothetical protein
MRTIVREQTGGVVLIPIFAVCLEDNGLAGVPILEFEGAGAARSLGEISLVLV